MTETLLEQTRRTACEQLRRMGFEPYNGIVGEFNPEKNLQYLWRMANCRRDKSEIMWAIVDALTQEGIAAWPGDATSCVEQMVRAQYDRAEAAEAELRKRMAMLLDRMGGDSVVAYQEGMTTEQFENAIYQHFVWYAERCREEGKKESSNENTR